jgi:hypothetical protein
MVTSLRSKWAARPGRGPLRMLLSLKLTRVGRRRIGYASIMPATASPLGPSRLRPIFIATLWAARLLAGCFVAHRSKTTAGILPLRFAHPAKIRGSATTPVTDLVH